ncbi:uncharacterized protein QC761_0028540 [Podospora bellae-mahoneyi]|uniref:Monooxygenase n=1 Tax=Podospora bellae-mahoneyi TaxID=2093777 RepID=A0ABR0FSB4_9PEZI|nr:hypothetical protein QC761_0028540 [Podospora bellae-mahoneyi]
MGYTQEPLPWTLSGRSVQRYGLDAPFRHREVIRTWIEDIFTRGGSDKHLSLHTTVERAEKVNGEWKVIVVSGSVSAHELVHEILPFAQKPLISSIRGDPIPSFGWTPFIHPHIVIKKQISSLCLTTGTVFFTDGSKVKDVDHIIFATGYTFSFPFLPVVQERVKKANRRLPGVYQHTFDILDPTLTFVGMLGGGFTFKVYEWQAVAVVRHLAGRAQPLPPFADQQRWEAKRAAAKKGGKDYYSIAPDYKDFFEFSEKNCGRSQGGNNRPSAARILR